MTGFEMDISGVGSNRSTNFAQSSSYLLLHPFGHDINPYTASCEAVQQMCAA